MIRRDKTILLVDCGFGLRAVEQRLAALDLAPNDLTAILVTHEHTDHVGGVGALARRFCVPVWLTRGTHLAARTHLRDVPRLHYCAGEQSFTVGDLTLFPVTVPHDAREPVQFVVADGVWRLGLLTDVGRITPHILTHFADLDALLLEFNHDPDMLRTGRYPPSLKARIAGGWGHLSNGEAAAALRQLRSVKLQHVVALHLSEQNNAEHLARAEAAAALDCAPEWIGVAGQDVGFAWRTLR